MHQAAPRKVGSYGIYVHVPWCATRCPYCAFNTYVEDAPPYGRWRDGVLAEWALRAPAFGGEAETLFFGGGTPSLAPPELLGSIVSALPLHPGAEVTAEANPGTVTEAKLEALRAAGINRLSLGIQTFQPKHARLLNRGHTVRQARELIAMVRRGGFDSWSVDIIFGLPEQTLAEFHQDLEAILETEPPHVSLYGLTFEPGTPLTRARDAGGIHALDPDTWHAMYEAACTALRAGGWERYEISNFARPGHRAQHNDAVWRGAHYAGLGPGAHGFLPDGRRTRNADKLEDWLASPAGEIELPSPKQHALDMVLTTLRHIDGLDLQALAQTGHPLPEDALTPLRDHGLVQLTGARVQLTDAGVWVADAVIRHLTDALSS